MDERKQKRRISNLEAARRSRMKKQQHLEDLVKEEAQLKAANSQMLMRVEALSQHHHQLELENTVLRTEAAELAEGLRSLNTVLRLVEGPGGPAVEAAEIPDPLLRPWQPPGPALFIMASADMLECWNI